MLKKLPSQERLGPLSLSRLMDSHVVGFAYSLTGLGEGEGERQGPEKKRAA